MSGEVALVGAGPGDPSLITVAGLEALRRAEVVLYDRLAAPELLAEASGAELIDVGKLPGDDGTGQDRIHQLMIEHARSGRRVVRLKGGDPFVFGRGGEEAGALRAAGMRVRVVPGVSSAVAAPALAGIPVTDRRAASAFTVLSGHDAAADAPQVDWNAVARTGGTIVVLMARRTLASVASRLIDGGLPPDTPTAAIASAGTPDQRAVSAPVSQLAVAVEQASLEAPLTVVIGKVVDLADHAHRDRRPLAGFRVLVARPRAQTAELSARLRAAGAQVVTAPAIELIDVDPAPADAAMARLPGGYDDIVFTSVNGVERFFARLESHDLDARALSGARIAAVGPATAAALRRQGVRADLIPPRFTTAALLASLRAEQLEGRRILLARAAQGSRALSDGLRDSGALIDDIPLYDVRTAPSDRQALERLRRDEIDVVVLTSPSVARGFAEHLRTAGLDSPSSARVAAIGPVTADAARALGLSVPIVAQDHTVAGLVEALIAHLETDSP